MSELLPPPPPPPLPRERTSGFGDPALVFPEFAAKQCVLEKVPEEEGEGEDSSYGKGSFDLSSRFSSSSISRNEFLLVDFPRKTSSLKLSGFPEEEEIDHNGRISASFADRIGQEEKRNCSGCFRTCCAVTCMLVSILLIILLLTGLTVNASIKSKLPEVSVTNLKFSRLNITKSSTDLLLNLNLDTVLELSNKNDKTVLDYGPMKADVSSESINLGQKKLAGFKQNPGDVISLKIGTRLRKARVYDDDSTLLRDKEKKRETVVNVFVKGKMRFDWLGFRLRLPLVIACEDVKQSDVLKSLKPQCDVRIFS